MIFGTPISWFINKIIASVLFLLCIVHILKNEKPIQKLLELFCYVLTAGIFENIGVWAGIYDYSLHRILLFGRVPFAVLFLEAVIVYSAVTCGEVPRLPKWALPFAAAVLASIQDMTLDPSSVYDLHTFGASQEGQWNWAAHYEGGFAGIPFFNFSGWLTMVLFFTACIQAGRFLAKKYNKTWLNYAYPFFSVLVTVLLLVSPLNQFLLYAMPFVPMNTKTAELIMLCINYCVCIFILLRFAKYSPAQEIRKNGIAFAIPIFLHLYALVSSILLGITYAVPVILIVAVLHCGYIIFVYRKLCHRI